MSDPGSPVPRAGKPKTFGMLGYWLTLILICLFGLFPMLLFIAGLIIGDGRDCNINENVASVCMIDGTNWGPTLQFFGLAPLYLLATIPIAFVLFVVWLIALLVHQHYFYKRLKPA